MSHYHTPNPNKVRMALKAFKGAKTVKKKAELYDMFVLEAAWYLHCLKHRWR